MVKQGDFSVALVEAETKTKFQEHTGQDGKIYVEVEPDIEYFIRVASTANEVLCNISVDGETLGYNATLREDGEPFDGGLWSYTRGQSTMTALKFSKAKVSVSGTGVEAPTFWTGEVKVDFYEAVFDGYYKEIDHKSSWKGGDVGYVMGMSDPTKKKGIKASEGTVTETQEGTSRNAMSTRYKQGTLLKTIRLNYCSALGLIHAGVLPKPPLWDLHRMTNPRKRDENEEPLIDPKKMRVGGNHELVHDLSND